MDGQPVDPESAWSGYAGATRANPPPGAVKRSHEDYDCEFKLRRQALVVPW